tara:strand:+ start:1198 stop:1344 length:147 start_codon:yes stop_codon:yes gene_type:complete
MCNFFIGIKIPNIPSYVYVSDQKFRAKGIIIDDFSIEFLGGENKINQN